MDCIILTAHKFGPLAKTAGPYRVATQLRQNGFTVQVIDISQVKDLIKLKLIIARFLKPTTLWVGLSNTFMEEFLGATWPILNGLRDRYNHQKLFDNFTAFKDIVNRKFPNVKLIYGDAGARTDITDLGYIKFDGYVDEDIVEFTKKCRDNLPVPNKVYKKEFKEFTTSNIVWTDKDLFMGEKALPIEIARGCIFQCKFCRYPLIGKKKFDYIKDQEVLYKELVYNYEKFGIQDYLFTDDTYNDSVYKVKLIKETIDRLPFKINFATYLRLDLMMRFPEMVPLLAESGLIGAHIGIETMDEQDAKFIGKGTPFRKQIDFLHEIKSKEFKNINVTSSFIIGLPNDNIEKINKLYNWFKSNDNPLDTYGVRALRLLPPGADNLYASELDRNYEKYGYKQFLGEDNQYYWIHEENKLNQLELYEIEKEISLELMNSTKIGSFQIFDYINLGVSKEDIFNLTESKVRKKYNIAKILADAQETYIKKVTRL